MITVTTYFWRDPTRDNRGYTFNHDHIRILKNMVHRNITVPHKFVCVTDDIIDGVETSPLNWEKHIPGTVYLRLMQHNPEIARQLGDRIFNLDLDVVITGNLDHLLKRQEDFIIWKNPNYGQPQRAYFQSSVSLFTAGSRPQLWNLFNPKETPKWVNWRFGGREQAWISECLDWDTTAVFTEQDGIYGAGRLGGAGVYSQLPANACIVSFPGAREPSQPETQEKHPWIKEYYL